MALVTCKNPVLHSDKHFILKIASRNPLARFQGDQYLEDLISLCLWTSLAYQLATDSSLHGASTEVIFISMLFIR